MGSDSCDVENHIRKVLIFGRAQMRTVFLRSHLDRHRQFTGIGLTILRPNHFY